MTTLLMFQRGPKPCALVENTVYIYKKKITIAHHLHSFLIYLALLPDEIQTQCPIYLALLPACLHNSLFGW